MPLIMPIKDLRNITEISNIAHKEQEPVFITKNGYSDLVVMSSFFRFLKAFQLVHDSRMFCVIMFYMIFVSLIFPLSGFIIPYGKI